MNTKNACIGTTLLLLAGLASGCTVNNNASGGGFSGGAAGSPCLPQSQGQGCFAAGTQHSRMTCDASASIWVLLANCAVGEFCVEAGDPAAPGKMITTCAQPATVQPDAGPTDGATPNDATTAGPVCGNGICEAPENTATCAADCKATGPVCGNGICEAPENTASCAADCKATGPVCGNGKCEAPETAETCAKDCA